MWLLSARRSNRARRHSTRRVQPRVEGYEPRLLLSGTTAATAVISGTAYRDIYGDGPTGALTPESGVTVQLFKAGSATPIATTVSASNGTYSFTKLATGNYTVKEVVPKGWVQTGGIGGFAVDLTKAGQTVSGKYFDNFDASLYSTSAVSNEQYTVTSPSGTVTHPTSLNGNIQQGDTVTIHFLLSKPEMIELASYIAPNSSFGTPANLSGQILFDYSESLTTTTGYQTVTVKVPNDYFQLDFVAGPVIARFGATGSNIDYHAQDRFIAAATGGTEVYGPSSVSGAVDVGTGKAATSLAGVTVVLTGYDYAGHEVKKTAVTNAQGDYSFTGLAASNTGGYRITQDVPAGYVQDGHAKFITLYVNSNTNRAGQNFVDSASQG